MASLYITRPVGHLVGRYLSNSLYLLLFNELITLRSVIRIFNKYNMYCNVLHNQMDTGAYLICVLCSATSLISDCNTNEIL